MGEYILINNYDDLFNDNLYEVSYEGLEKNFEENNYYKIYRPFDAIKEFFINLKHIIKDEVIN